MNILQIENKEMFDEAVWQTNTDFDEQGYNTWLKNSTDNLQKTKNFIEELQESDGNIDKTALEGIDVYMLGDLVNLLTEVHIKMNPAGH